jgi:TonB family protein
MIMASSPCTFHRFVLVCLAVLLAIPSSHSATQEYPHWWAGYPAPRMGMVLLHVDSPSGRVTKISMYKSTGDRRLDAYAIDSFKRVRFKPGTVPLVRIPVEFTKLGMRTVPRID